MKQMIIPVLLLVNVYIGLVIGKYNVAFGKVTTQSSTGWNGPSSLAVDGNTNTNYDMKSCTHTDNNGINWWCVDLQRNIDFQNIKIYNRDEVQDRLQGFEIRLSSDGGCNANGYRQSTVCYKDTSSPQDIYKIDSCNQPEVEYYGRYVYISIPKPYLTLCEVEIYESKENIAFRKVTAQSSTGWTGFSLYAVDGNTNNNYDMDSCTHTNNNGINWWCVDLKSDTDLQNINIYNRNILRERLQGFELRLSSNGGCNDNGYKQSTLCYKDTSSSQQNVYRIESCKQTAVQFTGRYVYVSLPKPYLTLCEVEIYERPCTMEVTKGEKRHPIAAEKSVSFKNNEDCLNNCAADNTCSYAFWDNGCLWFTSPVSYYGFIGFNDCKSKCFADSNCQSFTSHVTKYIRQSCYHYNTKDESKFQVTKSEFYSFGVKNC